MRLKSYNKQHDEWEKANNQNEKLFRTGAAAPGEEQRNNRAVSERGTGAAARGSLRWRERLK